MEQRILGRTGLKVSVLGFGGAEIGFAGVKQQEVSRLVAEVLEAGVTFFDTAAAYLTGEELLGHALIGKRHQVVLTTKCGAVAGFSRSDWSKEGILATVRQSLKNLQTDYVDVLLLHSCGQLEMQWGQALAGLQAAREAGYTRYIGYSGDGPAALWAAQSGNFDVLETSVSILDQEAIRLHLPVAAEAGIGVVAKRSIGNAVWRHTSAPANQYHLEYWRRWKALGFDFSRLSSSEIASIALRFTLSQPGVHCAIVGTTKPGRHRENLDLLKAGPLAPNIAHHIQERWAATADQYWVGQI